MTHYARRTDDNHAAIRDGLRAPELGYEVIDRSNIGRGEPDLMVKTRQYQRPLWVEIKMPGEHLTAAESTFFEFWGDCCIMVTSIEDAINQIEHKDCFMV